MVCPSLLLAGLPCESKPALLPLSPCCCREELRQRFPGKPWVDVLSKADLLEEELDAADQLLGAAGAAGTHTQQQQQVQQQQQGQQPASQQQPPVSDAVQFAAALPAALRVSSTSGEGVDALKLAMLQMLEQQPLGQQQGAAADAAEDTPAG